MFFLSNGPIYKPPALDEFILLFASLSHLRNVSSEASLKTRKSAALPPTRRYAGESADTKVCSLTELQLITKLPWVYYYVGTIKKIKRK